MQSRQAPAIPIFQILNCSKMFGTKFRYILINILATSLQWMKNKSGICFEILGIFSTFPDFFFLRPCCPLFMSDLVINWHLSETWYMFWINLLDLFSVHLCKKIVDDFVWVMFQVLVIGRAGTEFSPRRFVESTEPQSNTKRLLTISVSIILVPKNR